MKGGLSKRYLLLKCGTTKSPLCRISRAASANRGSSRSSSGIIHVPAKWRRRLEQKIKTKLRIVDDRAGIQRYERVKHNGKFVYAKGGPPSLVAYCAGTWCYTSG